MNVLIINKNLRMKQLIPVLAFALIVLSGCAAKQSSWKSPNYKQQRIQKVMVLAKTSDELARRQLEDATVQELKTKGINAVPSYANINPEDLKSEEAFIEKATVLEVDALLAYNFGNIKSEYKRKPSINANVGVPVRLGIFRGFLGTNVPLAGGNRKVETVNGQAVFYTKGTTTIQWSQALTGDLKNGTQKLASDFASKTVNKMVEDQLF